MKFDFGKGYWSNKPMAQQLECIATGPSAYVPNSEIDLIDLEGLIKIGVRFPDIEWLMGKDERLIELCAWPY